MAHTTFDRVLAEAKTLSLDEQRQLRDHLEAWLTTLSTPMSEVEFEQQLVAQGILSDVPPPITDVMPYQQRPRIQAHGQPLSETIIEERG
jgi:hypothetical protein